MATEPEPQRHRQRYGDASRRTHLANERTYLAWWRSGLTALAVAVGVGRLVPELSRHESSVFSVVAGVGFALLGIFFIGYATHRARAVRRALDDGIFSHPDARVLTGLAVAGTALGLLTIAIVVQAF
jgi:putative membrane protein